MKWINASEKLPADQQEVLIKSEGHVNLARFQKKEGIFLLRNGTTVAVKSGKVEWTELVAPPK